MNRKEIQTQLSTIKNNFKSSFLDVSDILDLPFAEITRDDYVRVTVDWDVATRLNKEELNLIGGYKVAKDELLHELGKVSKPKILVLDIETFPLEVFTWGLFKQNIALNQIKEDWSILSYAAKFIGEDKIYYSDVRDKKNKRDDKDLCLELHGLLDSADFVLTQNGKKFDLKKIRARMLKHNMKPFSSIKHIDTLLIAKNEFGFTSNKLEYMTHNFCTESKKVIDRKYVGQSLWTECLNDNKEAYDEMEIYNKGDITSLEELAMKLIPWSSLPININLFHSEDYTVCFCGSTSFKRSGYYYTSVSKFQKYQCECCGAELRDRQNLIKKDKRKKLKQNTVK